MVGEDPIVKQLAETDDAASMKIHSCFHPNKEIIGLGSFRFLFRLVFASVLISSTTLVCAAPTGGPCRQQHGCQPLMDASNAVLQGSGRNQLCNNLNQLSPLESFALSS